MASFSLRDLERMRGVHPDLIAALEMVFDEMDADGTPMFVVCGVRTVAEQQALYAQGRDGQGHVVGRVVTYKDGVTHKSNHQPHADGLGHAVDAAFKGDQPFDPRHPWHLYGERVEARGLIWGGRWKAPVDCPHAELPDAKITPLKT